MNADLGVCVQHSCFSLAKASKGQPISYVADRSVVLFVEGVLGALDCAPTSDGDAIVIVVLLFFFGECHCHK